LHFGPCDRVLSVADAELPENRLDMALNGIYRHEELGPYLTLIEITGSSLNIVSSRSVRDWCLRGKQWSAQPNDRSRCLSRETRSTGSYPLMMPGASKTGARTPSWFPCDERTGARASNACVVSQGSGKLACKGARGPLEFNGRAGRERLCRQELDPRP
jgi:hypothetical protein